MQPSPSFDAGRFWRVCWTIYAILAASYLLVFFHRIAPAVVSADLMRDFGATGAALGSLAATYYYIYTAMQIPAGVLADTVGTRILVTVGNVISGLGSIGFGLAATLWQASLSRTLVGLGVSVVFVGLMKSNTLWFRDRDYGFVSGLTLLVGNLGAILATGPLAGLLTLWSWRTIFIALGIIALIFGIFSWIIVRDTPEAAGFPSVRAMDGKPSHAARHQPWWRDLFGVLANRQTWPSFWVNLGMPGSFLAFIGLWAIPFLRDAHGLERSVGSWYTSLALAGFACGALFHGWCSDRLGRRKPLLVIGVLLYGVTWLVLTQTHWTPGGFGMAWFFLMGFSCGSFVLTYAGAKEVVAPALSGMAIALVNTGIFLGAALIQPLFGWIMDLSWQGTMVNGIRGYGLADYQAGFYLMLASVALAVIASVFFHETHCRNITVHE